MQGARRLVARLGGRRRCGERVRVYLAGEPHGARRDSAGVPDQGVIRHRLSWLRQPADDLLAAPSRPHLGGAPQRLGAGGGAAVVVGVGGVDLRQAGGATGAKLATPAVVWADTLALTLVWFVVRNLGFGPFPRSMSRSRVGPAVRRSGGSGRDCGRAPRFRRYW